MPVLCGGCLAESFARRCTQSYGTIFILKRISYHSNSDGTNAHYFYQPGIANSSVSDALIAVALKM